MDALGDTSGDVLAVTAAMGVEDAGAVGVEEGGALGVGGITLASVEIEVLAVALAPLEKVVDIEAVSEAVALALGLGL